jgi:serine/threonine protein kinase
MRGDEKIYLTQITMEYYGRGDLEKLINTCKKKQEYLPHEEIMKYFKQLANGVKSLHDDNIIHRDLKPLNVFISDSDQCKIGGNIIIIYRFWIIKTESRTRNKCHS